MTFSLEVEGHCNKIVNGEECGGDVIENRMPARDDSAIMGSDHFPTYKCKKCRQDYDTPPVKRLKPK